jgi:tetratricopeptide (TPR) repeat protein
MAMAGLGAPLKVYLIGVFRLARAGEVEIALKGKKSCALFAMLATAPGHSRSKAWLIDHLWSDRSPEQASGSLRQALREIRSVLGSQRDTLCSDQSVVRLLPDRVWIDVEHSGYLSDLAAHSNEEIEFLSNIDVNDREYEHWVRDKRLHYSGILKAQRKTLAGAGNLSADSDEASAPTLLRATAVGSDQKRQVFSEILSDLVCKSLKDAGSVRIVNLSPGRQSGTDENPHVLRLDSKAFDFGSQAGAGITLTRQGNHCVVLNSLRTLEGKRELSLERVEILQLINEAADRSIREFAQMFPVGDDRRSAASLCFHGVSRLFEFRFGDLLEIDRNFEEAFKLDKRATYLIWRAYLRTFILGERPDISREKTIEEMKEFMFKALELEPENSLVLSLCAFITSMWLLDHAAGLVHARRSVDINPANPFGVAFLGMAHSHSGNLEKGYRLTRKATEISSLGPYRQVLVYTAMSGAAYAGHHEEAIRHGEALMRLAPNYGAPQRILGLLYRKVGQNDKSELIVDSLRKAEPQFSFKLMKEAMYRSAIVRKTELMSGV